MMTLYKQTYRPGGWNEEIWYHSDGSESKRNTQVELSYDSEVEDVAEKVAEYVAENVAENVADDQPNWGDQESEGEDDPVFWF